MASRKKTTAGTPRVKRDRASYQAAAQKARTTRQQQSSLLRMGSTQGSRGKNGQIRYTNVSSEGLQALRTFNAARASTRATADKKRTAARKAAGYSNF